MSGNGGGALRFTSAQFIPITIQAHYFFLIFTDGEMEVLKIQ